MSEFVLRANTQLARFVTANNPVDVIEGPLGSGKTYGLCMRIMRHAQEQRASPIDGRRHTQMVLIRNTMPDLKRSTIRTWLRLFPEEVYGRFNWGAAMHHRIRYAWGGGDVDTMVDFLSLDKEEDVRKLRSTEYTVIGFDELEFIDKILVDEARSRLRYPPPDHGGPTYRGVIAATNAPPEDHWLTVMTGRAEFPPGLRPDELAALKWPKEWGHYLQPPALIELLDQHGQVTGYEVNPDAENLRNLPPTYYQEQIQGQTRAWIDSRLMVRTVLVTDGAPVHPQFRREVHVSHEILRPRAGYSVTVGLDFGRSPAALFMQEINGRVQFQFEVIGANESASLFAPRVKRFIVENFPEHDLEDFRFFGDPKGQDKGQADERTAYEVFAANGMTVRPAPDLKNNMIKTRVEAMDHLLMRMVDGKPAFISSPVCRKFNVGMAGRYCNELDDKGELRPTKNPYSHVCEAGHYGVLGLGEGRLATGRQRLGAARVIPPYRRKTMRRVSA